MMMVMYMFAKQFSAWYILLGDFEYCFRFASRINCLTFIEKVEDVKVCSAFPLCLFTLQWHRFGYQFAHKRYQYWVATVAMPLMFARCASAFSSSIPHLTFGQFSTCSSKCATKSLKKQGIGVLQQPIQSPDFSPIVVPGPLNSCVKTKQHL